MRQGRTRRGQAPSRLRIWPTAVGACQSGPTGKIGMASLCASSRHAQPVRLLTGFGRSVVRPASSSLRYARGLDVTPLRPSFPPSETPSHHDARSLSNSLDLPDDMTVATGDRVHQNGGICWVRSCCPMGRSIGRCGRSPAHQRGPSADALTSSHASGAADLPHDCLNAAGFSERLGQLASVCHPAVAPSRGGR